MSVKGQISSSLNNSITNEYINFLLSVTRKNQKIVHAAVNNILYNYIIHRCVQLNCSISEYIKRLIIKDLLENNVIKLDDMQKDLAKNISISNVSHTKEEDDDFIDSKMKKRLLNKLNSKRVKKEISEIKRELNTLYNDVKKYCREKYQYRYIVPPSHQQLCNRLEILRARVAQLLKMKIPRQFIDDLEEIIDKINDIDELLDT